MILTESEAELQILSKSQDGSFIHPLGEHPDSVAREST